MVYYSKLILDTSLESPHFDELFIISNMQFYNITILKDVVSFYHYPVVLA